MLPDPINILYVILQMLNRCQAHDSIEPPKAIKKLGSFCITDHEGGIGGALMVVGMRDDFLIIVYTGDFAEA